MRVLPFCISHASRSIRICLAPPSHRNFPLTVSVYIRTGKMHAGGSAVQPPEFFGKVESIFAVAVCDSIGGGVGRIAVRGGDRVVADETVGAVAGAGRRQRGTGASVG